MSSSIGVVAFLATYSSHDTILIGSVRSGQTERL
jgi:hypothetical protein